MAFFFGTMFFSSPFWIHHQERSFKWRRLSFSLSFRFNSGKSEPNSFLDIFIHHQTIFNNPIKNTCSYLCCINVSNVSRESSRKKIKVPSVDCVTSPWQNSIDNDVFIRNFLKGFLSRKWCYQKDSNHLENGLSEDFYLYQNKNIKTKTKHIALFSQIYNNWQM